MAQCIRCVKIKRHVISLNVIFLFGHVINKFTPLGEGGVGGEKNNSSMAKQKSKMTPTHF